VFEHVIDGKTYYVTSLTNGEIFDVDDDEFENPVGTIKNGKVTMTM
jgi:YHS domain-containing protein